MRKSVPIEIAEDIISMAQEENLYLHSYSDTCVVSPKDGAEVKLYCSRTGMEYQVSDDLLKTIGHAPCKLLAIDMENHGRLEAFRSRIQEKNTATRSPQFFPIRFILKFSIRPPGRKRCPFRLRAFSDSAFQQCRCRRRRKRHFHAAGCRNCRCDGKRYARGQSLRRFYYAAG